MNIIIPMAGMGKRLRPHTLLTPKPLVSVAGKPIVQHLVEDIAALIPEKIEQVIFVTGRFGKEAEQMLISVAAELGAKGVIAYQDEPLGTAHAIWMAKAALRGKTIVAFADTLFQADFKFDDNKDGILWVKQIKDPSAFGVVKLDDQGNISDFVEKPKEFVSDLAMIGIYYFKDGERLAEEIKYLLDNEVMKGGEYQLPDALRRLTEKGLKFIPGKVDDWMDCGNAAVTIATNSRMLELKFPNSEINASARLEHSVIIDPCYVAEGATISGSVIGPHVTIGSHSVVSDSRIISTLVQDFTEIANCTLTDSMIGSRSTVRQDARSLSVGDYNTLLG